MQRKKAAKKPAAKAASPKPGKLSIARRQIVEESVWNDDGTRNAAVFARAILSRAGNDVKAVRAMKLTRANLAELDKGILLLMEREPKQSKRFAGLSRFRKALANLRKK